MAEKLVVEILAGLSWLRSRSSGEICDDGDEYWASMTIKNLLNS
jgi:hypothetical protein